MVKVTTKLIESDLIKLNYSIASRSPVLILVFFSGVANLVGFISDQMGGDVNFQMNPMVNLAMGLAFTFLVPISIYFNSKKAFRTNNLFHEKIDWEINENNIKLKGNLFESEIKWQGVHKIRLLKKWTLIYTNKTVANVIPTTAWSSIDDYEKFLEYAQLNKIAIQ